MSNLGQPPKALETTAALMQQDPYIISPDDLILVTGAGGFIGRRLVETLLRLGFRNLRCFVRPSSQFALAEAFGGSRKGAFPTEVVRGNLLSRGDCELAANGAKVIFHLAAGRGEKSFPDAFLNSVVTTRNLLEACSSQGGLKRFVNVSSFSVYAGAQRDRKRVLDESCPVETRPELRGEAYCFAKTKQDEIVKEYGQRFGLPYVIVRPGYVYGPGNPGITGRVGISTFGIFLHLGGSNTIPLTYVDNCAEAIALAGLTKGVEGQTFNVVDDDLISSSRLLRMYKQNVKKFRSLYVPHAISYVLCFLWERYSVWSEGQLPLSFNRSRWHAYWKKTRYTNQKLKSLVRWHPKVSTAEGLQRYFAACRNEDQHA